MSRIHLPISRRSRRTAAGAAAALAIAGVLAGCGSSSSTSTTAAATPAAATSRAQPTPHGFGTPATGAAADTAKAAALAKYPGTVERVMTLADGSYVVHVLRSSGGEVHVEVSKAFAVTGTEQGPPAGVPPAPGSGTTT
jgi:hypothetical protein